MNINSLSDLEAIKNDFLNKEKQFQFTAHICYAAGCLSSDCKAFKEAFVKALENSNLQSKVSIKLTGCMGACSLGPTLIINPGNILYCNLNPANAQYIVDHHIKKGKIAEKFCYKDDDSGVIIPDLNNIPFFKHQQKIVLRNCGTIDYGSVGEYISREGYFALAKVRNFNEFDGQKVLNPVDAPGSKWQPGNTKIYKGAYSGGLGYGWDGGWMWGSSPEATLRSADTGAPLSSMDNQNMSPVNVYASWNDQPFVAPLTAAQTTAAKASNETLTGLGEQVDARTAEYDKVAGLIGAKGERVAMDVEMGQNRAGEEQAAPVAGSAFNELNVFQSIADWLK